MKNLINFLKHYPQVILMAVAYLFFFYQLNWPSKFAESLLHNSIGTSLLVTSSFNVGMTLIVVFYIRNQWGLFKKSEWYKK